MKNSFLEWLNMIYSHAIIRYLFPFLIYSQLFFSACNINAILMQKDCSVVCQNVKNNGIL